MEENKFEFRNLAHQYLAAITGEILEKCLKFILTDKAYFFHFSQFNNAQSWVW